MTGQQTTQTLRAKFTQGQILDAIQPAFEGGAVSVERLEIGHPKLRTRKEREPHFRVRVVFKRPNRLDCAGVALIPESGGQPAIDNAISEIAHHKHQGEAAADQHAAYVSMQERRKKAGLSGSRESGEALKDMVERAAKGLPDL